MAIKVGGTTVVDDSRNICNAVTINATTLCATNICGNGANISGLSTSGGGECVTGTTCYTITSSNQRNIAICLTSNPVSGDVRLPDATTLTKGSPTFTIKNLNCATTLVLRDAVCCVLGTIPACYTATASLWNNSTCQGNWSIGNFSAPLTVVEISGLCASQPLPTACSYLDNNNNLHVIGWSCTASCVACYQAFKKGASGYTLSSNTITFPVLACCIALDVRCIPSGGWVLTQGYSCQTGAGSLGCNATFIGVINCDGTYSNTFYDCTKQCCFAALGCTTTCGNWWASGEIVCRILCNWLFFANTIMNNTTDSWWSSRIHCFNACTTGVPTICQALYRGLGYPSGACRLCSSNYLWAANPCNEAYFIVRTYGFGQDGCSRITDLFCFCNNGNVCYYCLCGANAAGLVAFTDYQVSSVSYVQRICGSPALFLTKFNPGASDYQTQVALKTYVCNSSSSLGACLSCLNISFQCSGGAGNTGTNYFSRLTCCGLFVASYCDCTTQTYHHNFQYIACTTPLCFCSVGNCCTYAYYDFNNQNCHRHLNLTGFWSGFGHYMNYCQVCDLECGCTLSEATGKNYHIVCDSTTCAIWWAPGCVIGDTCVQLVRMAACMTPGAGSLTCVCRWIFLNPAYTPGYAACLGVAKWYMGTADCLCIYNPAGIFYRICLSGGGTWATNCCNVPTTCFTCLWGCSGTIAGHGVACNNFYCTPESNRFVYFGALGACSGTQCGVYYYDYTSWPPVSGVAGCIDNKLRTSTHSYDCTSCKFISWLSCCSTSGALNTEVAVGTYVPNTCTLSSVTAVALASLCLPVQALQACAYSVIYNCTCFNTTFYKTFGRVTLI